MSKRRSESHSHLLEDLIEEMRKAHLRVTEPRIAILQALIRKHGPFTAEEIHEQVTKKVCDLATIYRSLASLEKAAIIKRCEFGDGTARYEFFESQKHHHHHVICKSCRKIEVLEDCELDDIDRFAKKIGFSDVSHSLEFFGICADCSKKA